jgi:predicted Zn finger-like uncharacterized protein
MIIECPACQSRYRIREEKLPAGGGNIKCPSCAHVFFVAREASSGAPAPPVSSPGVVAGSDPNGWSQIPIGNPASMPGAISSPDAAPSPGGTLALTGVGASALLNAAAQPPPPLAGDSGPRKWKLRNAVGLVYDFTDTDQLVKWLGSKESHDGMQASDDGGSSFKELFEFVALRDVRPSRKTMMGMPAIVPPPVNAPSSSAVSMTKSGDYTADAQAAAAMAAAQQAAAQSGGGNSRPADQAAMQLQAQARLDQARKARGADVSQPVKMDKPAAKPGAGQGGASGSGKASAGAGQGGAPGSGKASSRLPSNALRRDRTEEQGSWLGMIGVLSIPLIIAGIVQVTGLFDFRQLFGGQQEQAGVLPLPGNSLPPVDQGPTETDYVQPVDMSPSQQAALAIDAAAAAVSQEHFEEAVGHLERATFLAPERVELQCQLADLYDRTSRPEDAARTRARCNGTDATAGSGAALPADGSAPIAEGSAANPEGSAAP